MIDGAVSWSECGQLVFSFVVWLPLLRIMKHVSESDIDSGL